MTSQTGQQIITIHILPNIAKSKGNQAIKLGQLIIEHNMKNSFAQKSCRKRGRETSFRPLFVFKKALYKIKTSGQYLLT